MSDKGERTGKASDWPVGLVIAGALIFVLSAVNGGTAGAFLGLALGAFGVVSLLIRRGAFTPRR